MSKINRKVSKWLKALERGEFKQARNSLHSNDPQELSQDVEELDLEYHCCIGVAECLMSPAKRSKNLLTGGGAESERYQAIKDWLELDQVYFEDLIALNDIGDYSFEEIAAHVRKKFEEG